jgi:methylmalonyl-CoA/ethylmalonyl-CoA epimerase
LLLRSEGRLLTVTKTVNTSVLSFHHLGVAVKDLAAAEARYQRLFGYERISGPFDDPIQGVSVSFLARPGDETVIELVAPLGPALPGSGVSKRAGIYHICYAAPDLKQAIDHAVSEGASLLSEPVPAVAFGGKCIAWLMADAGLLVELVQA